MDEILIQNVWNCYRHKVRTFWETHKIWKNLPHGFDKSADLLSKRQNHKEDFFQILCVSQKVRALLDYYSLGWALRYFLSNYFPFLWNCHFKTFHKIIKPFKVFINPFLVFLKPLSISKIFPANFQNNKNVWNKCSLDVNRGKVILKF